MSYNQIRSILSNLKGLMEDSPASSTLPHVGGSPQERRKQFYANSLGNLLWEEEVEEEYVSAEILLYGRWAPGWGNEWTLVTSGLSDTSKAQWRFEIMVRFSESFGVGLAPVSMLPPYKYLFRALTPIMTQTPALQEVFALDSDEDGGAFDEVYSHALLVPNRHEITAIRRGIQGWPATGLLDIEFLTSKEALLAEKQGVQSYQEQKYNQDKGYFFTLNPSL
jgi:hypothetical protein